MTLIDIFLVTILLVVAPYFIFNPSAESEWNALRFSPAPIFAAEAGIVLMFVTMGISLVSARYVFPVGDTVASMETAGVYKLNLGKAALIGMALLLVVLLLLPDFVRYRIITLQFLGGDLGTDEYVVARRLAFSESLGFEVLNRIRFSILPVLLLSFLFEYIVRKRIFFSAVFSFIFFIIYAISLSKLPFVYYFGYIAIMFAYIHGYMNNFSMIKLMSAAVLAILLVILLLIPLYMLQYSEVSGFEAPFDKPLFLAIERIWGENYSIILRYFTLYPDYMPYAGFSGINVVAGLFNLPYRNIDIEVPGFFFGREVLTTNPGVFILSGYASFGYLGIFVYTVIAVWLVAFLDFLHTRIYTRAIASVYFATLAVNVTFLAQLALPTSLLTYGIGVVPFLLFLVDRVSFKRLPLDLVARMRNAGVPSRRPAYR